MRSVVLLLLVISVACNPAKKAASELYSNKEVECSLDSVFLSIPIGQSLFITIGDEENGSLTRHYEFIKTNDSVIVESNYWDSSNVHFVRNGRNLIAQREFRKSNDIKFNKKYELAILDSVEFSEHVSRVIETELLKSDRLAYSSKEIQKLHFYLKHMDSNGRLRRFCQLYYGPYITVQVYLQKGKEFDAICSTIEIVKTDYKELEYFLK